MEFYPDTYYHLYNRSNNRELLFKEPENYLYFLRQYRRRFDGKLTTLAYCLMPTHFHFLIYNPQEEGTALAKEIGVWLSAYTKAINKRYDRNGSLLQRHTKAIPVTDDKYLLTLMTYIHQNPLRSELCQRLDDWPYSSYPEYIKEGSDSLVDRDRILDWFSSIEEFIQLSKETITEVDSRFWI